MPTPGYPDRPRYRMAVSNNCSQVQIVRTTKNPSPGRPEMGSVLEKLLKVGKLSSDRAHSVRECATTRGEAGCDAAATFAPEYGGAPAWPSRTPTPFGPPRRGAAVTIVANP